VFLLFKEAEERQTGKHHRSKICRLSTGLKPERKKKFLLRNAVRAEKI